MSTHHAIPSPIKPNSKWPRFWFGLFIREGPTAKEEEDAKAALLLDWVNIFPHGCTNTSCTQQVSIHLLIFWSDLLMKVNLEDLIQLAPAPVLPTTKPPCDVTQYYCITSPATWKPRAFWTIYGPTSGRECECGNWSSPLLRRATYGKYFGSYHLLSRDIFINNGTSIKFK